MNDVAIAKRCALRSEQPFGLMARYTMIQSSLHTGHMTSAVLVQLLVHGYWSPARALAEAHKLTENYDRFDALMLLAHASRDAHPAYGEQAARDAEKILVSLAPGRDIGALACRLAHCHVPAVRRSAFAVALQSLPFMDEEGTACILTQLPPELQRVAFVDALTRLPSTSRFAAIATRLVEKAPLLPKPARDTWVRELTVALYNELQACEASAENELFTCLTKLADAVDDDTEPMILTILAASTPQATQGGSDPERG